ncbi:complex proteins associated with Set1p component shg1-domain-containing protein [Trametes maxima]|nr:complex proteins associated with Set1p component shg1-domain-containing protein [Trametes maxima]
MSSSGVTNPTQLVEEFKKSGEFDRLRRELLKEFRQSEGMAALLARVEDIAKQKLASDPKLQYMPEANVTREIMQELERYPIVERAVNDVSSLSNATFASNVQSSVQKVLQENRQTSGQGTVNGQALTDGAQKGDDWDGESSAESMDLEDDDSSD